MFKLKIRVIRPPISIFELREGKDEIDRTEYFEHAFSDVNHLFWMVPDGKYMICQGQEPPCIVTVKKSKMTTWERNGKPAGNNVEKVSLENTDDKEDVADILHVHKTKTKTKHEDIVVEVVDSREAEKP